MPEISVVMGVYNGAEVLDTTLRSVLDQQDVDFECIVVNDGSNDATAQILDSTAARDQRVRVIHQPNAGLTRALIEGCRQARGQLIARQDAGDLSLPGRLRAQSSKLRSHPELAFVSCITEYVDASGAFLYHSAGSGAATEPLHVLDLSHSHGMRDGPSHHGSAMFHRSAYEGAGGYRAQFYFGQDWDLWYRLAAVGKFQMLPQTLYRAHIGVGDISSTRKPQQEALAALSQRAMRLRASGRADDEVLAEAAKIRPGASSAREKQHARAAGAYFLGECLRRNGDLDRAVDYFRMATRERPAWWRPHVRLAQSRVQRVMRPPGGRS